MSAGYDLSRMHGLLADFSRRIEEAETQLASVRRDIGTARLGIERSIEDGQIGFGPPLSDTDVLWNVFRRYVQVGANECAQAPEEVVVVRRALFCLYAMHYKLSPNERIARYDLSRRYGIAKNDKDHVWYVDADYYASVTIEAIRERLVGKGRVPFLAESDPPSPRSVGDIIGLFVRSGVPPQITQSEMPAIQSALLATYWTVPRDDPDSMKYIEYVLILMIAYDSIDKTDDPMPEPIDSDGAAVIMAAFASMPKMRSVDQIVRDYMKTGVVPQLTADERRHVLCATTPGPMECFGPRRRMDPEMDEALDRLERKI